METLFALPELKSDPTLWLVAKIWPWLLLALLTGLALGFLIGRKSR